MAHPRCVDWAWRPFSAPTAPRAPVRRKNVRNERVEKYKRKKRTCNRQRQRQPNTRPAMRPANRGDRGPRGPRGKTIAKKTAGWTAVSRPRGHAGRAASRVAVGARARGHARGARARRARRRGGAVRVPSADRARLAQRLSALSPPESQSRAAGAVRCGPVPASLIPRPVRLRLPPTQAPPLTLRHKSRHLHSSWAGVKSDVGAGGDGNGGNSPLASAAAANLRT